MASALYPLRFRPLFREYIWGGRRLETMLGKSPGDGDTIAESWEVVDHGASQSVVNDGPLAGKTLSELLGEYGPQMLGRHYPQERFPLLFKFLDCNRDLSVQVHPDDEGGAKLDPPDLGKTEAWVILHAEPGAKLYAGLKRGFDRQAFEREINRGATELCLHSFEPAAGDCIFIPAGVVHALGAGLVVAEIQQASDTTFRLFDWNRTGADGKPRELHIEQGLDAIDYERGPVDAVDPVPTSDTTVEQLVSCDKFILNRRTLSSENNRFTTGEDRFEIYTVLDGEVEVSGIDAPLGKGSVFFIPASVDAAISSDAATLLEMHLP